MINPYPPSTSPRLVRNADVLSENGYDVVVVSTRFTKQVLPYDVDLPGRQWRACFVDLADSLMGKARWQFTRARRKVCLTAATRFPSPTVIERACCYAGPELAELATRQDAALYIAHTHAALPSAAEAAARTGAKLAFDAEDLLAESSAESIPMIRAIEQFYVPSCSLVITMSRSAADRLRQTLKLRETPVVLHNTPSLKEREGLLPPEHRRKSKILSLYWFGQTIGPHSCADQLVRALPLLARPAKLVLRGNPNADYIDQLRRLASQLGVSDQLEVYPRALPGEMVRLAGEYDVSVGSQPSAELFHQMAIGNKVFTGLMAGTLVALTDTTAHRMLAQELGESAVLFPNSDERGLAQRLNRIIASDAKLLSGKCAAWRLAEERFNWERESRQFVRRVEEIIGGAK